MNRYFYFFFALFFSQIGLSEKWICASIDEVYSKINCKNSEGLTKTITKISELGVGNEFISSTPDGSRFIAKILENEVIKGKEIKSNGNIYEGEVKNKLFHGKGKQTNKETGLVYEGDWKEGIRSGKGKITLSNGATMEGDFAYGLINGQVVFRELDGSYIYKGSAKDGKFHGYGEDTILFKIDEYSGVGLYISHENYGITVTRLIEGSPAAESKKIKEGDQIISISNKRGKMIEVNKLDMEEVSNLLKGKEGTIVKIKIKKRGERFFLGKLDAPHTETPNNLTKKNEADLYSLPSEAGIGASSRSAGLASGEIAAGHGRDTELIVLTRRKMVIEEKETYKGMFKDSERDGFGRNTYSDGTYYEGTFKKGEWDGFGKRTWGMGNFYLGEYKNGNCEGFGVQLNEKYEIIYYGGFLDCKAHGQGGSIQRTDERTDIFSGTFKNNLLNGYGEAVYASGNTYKGFWKNGRWAGQGEAYFSKIQETYIGIWKDINELIDGKATLVSKYFIYEGEFKENLMHGLGKYTPLNIVDVFTTSKGKERYVKYLEGELVEDYIPNLSEHEEPKKIALIVGNGAYMSSRLENSVEDSRGMANTLENLGFKVIHKANLKKQSFIESIWEFSDQVASLGPDTTALFFYSGHAVQLDEKNYLIPVDSNMNSQKDIELEAVNSDLILRALGNAFTGTKILILDACRNNPFISKTKSSSGGLAPMLSSVGTFIGYATGPGKVALDGTSQGYSVYTGNLINAINTPGLTIEQVFKRTRSKVAEMTDNQQVPWDYSSLIGEFYFKKE